MLCWRPLLADSTQSGRAPTSMCGLPVSGSGAPSYERVANVMFNVPAHHRSPPDDNWVYEPCIFFFFSEAVSLHVGLCDPTALGEM